MKRYTLNIRNTLLKRYIYKLIMGIFMDGVEARRKILKGRKTITRHYYWGTAIPAWSIVLLIGISILFAGGGLYVLLQKFVVDNADTGESHASYQPALQTETAP